MAEPTPELKTYYGNCHCGAFKFNIKLPELKSVLECNCSICLRKGYQWVFPSAGSFTVEKGEGTLKDYEFGPCSMAHKFCPTCGTGIYGKRHGQPAGMDIGVNAKTLRDIDQWSLEVNKYDGKALEPAFSPPKYTGPEPTASIENAKIYTGSCHCGAVTLALKTQGPLPSAPEHIQECNCSICMRNGTVDIYPPATRIQIHDPSSNLTPYSFPPNFLSHEFCSVCGVLVYLKKLKVPEEVYNKRFGHVEDQKTWESVVPVNLRCFEGVEWDEIEIKRAEFRDHGLKYEV